MGRQLAVNSRQQSAGNRYPEAGSEMPGVRMLETTHLILTAKPFELFWIYNDITGMRATGELATARTMAVLKYVFRAVKLVADRLAQATTLDGFGHGRSLLVGCSVAQALSGQQIRSQ